MRRVLHRCIHVAIYTLIIKVCFHYTLEQGELQIFPLFFMERKFFKNPVNYGNQKTLIL